MDRPQESLSASPELFPYSMDVSGDTVGLIHLTRGDFAAASFLDARVLRPETAIRTLPWSQVAAAIESAVLGESCHYIFHIGHVGSTLLSRLIGSHPRGFALREPLVLRTLASLHVGNAQPSTWTADALDAHIGGCVRLLSRTFEPQHRAVVKATSFVSELSSRLLSRHAAPRALLMTVRPERYLATILGGPNSRQEARQLTPGRLQRIHARLGRTAWRLESFSEGEALALGWACEMSALASAARAAGARALWVDFDDFLSSPGSHLTTALRHLQIEATESEVRALVEGPVMRQYSKAPEFAYDAALRREVLDEARHLHGAEIRRGMRWLEQAAARFEVLRDALEAGPHPGS